MFETKTAFAQLLSNIVSIYVLFSQTILLMFETEEIATELHTKYSESIFFLLSHIKSNSHVSFFVMFCIFIESYLRATVCSLALALLQHHEQDNHFNNPEINSNKLNTLFLFRQLTES